MDGKPVREDIVRPLVELMRKGQRRTNQIEGAHRYIMHALDTEMIGQIASGHRRFASMMQREMSAGMFKAAVFSALRGHLPRDWFVQVVAPYPQSRSHTDDVADVLIWTPLDSPIIIEILHTDDYETVTAALDTILHHAHTLRSSPVTGGYAVFPVYDPRHMALWEDMRREWRPAWPVPVALY